MGRLLRLLPLAGLLLVILVGGVGLLSGYLGRTWTEDWTSERGVFGVQLCVGGVVFLAWAWFRGVYDLMRVEAVVNDEIRARYAFVRGLIWGLRHPLPLLGLALPYALLGIGFTVVASLIDVRLVRSSWGLFVLGGSPAARRDRRTKWVASRLDGEFCWIRSTAPIRRGATGRLSCPPPGFQANPLLIRTP